MRRLSSASRVFARVSGPVAARRARWVSELERGKVFVRRAALGGGRAEASRGSGIRQRRVRVARRRGSRGAAGRVPRAVRGRGGEGRPRGRRGGGSGAAPRADAPRAGRVPSRLLVIGRAREILHRGGARRARRERALEMRARRALRVRGGVWTRVGAAARGRGFEPAASRPHSRPGRGRARASGRLPAPWESAAGRRERGGREKRTKLDPEMRERSAREKCRSHRQGFFFSDSRGNWAIIPRPPRVAA